MLSLSARDRVVLALANIFAILRHPLLAASFLWRRGAPLFATPRDHAAMVQWRKIFDHNPLFPVLVDKLAVKRWAAATVPGIRSAEVLWSGTDPAAIPDALVSPGHVIKSNHATRQNYFPAREPMPRPELNRLLAGWIARPFDFEAQGAYLAVDRQLFVEREISGTEPLLEMTFRCSGGTVATAFIVSGQRQDIERNGYFDAEGHRLTTSASVNDAPLPPDFVPPPVFREARTLAEALSRDLDYVRVDLMWDGMALYLCEMTVYPGSGFGDEARTGIAPRIERNWLAQLDKSWLLSTPQPWPVRLYAEAFRRWVTLRRAELDLPARRAAEAGVSHPA